MNITVRFILVLVLISNLCQAQFTKHRDSIMWVRGIRIGCDISRFVLTQLDHDRKGMEVSGEIRLTPNLYPTVELGLEKVNFTNDLIVQSSNGQYARIGIDYNLRNYTKDFSNNIIFFGLRYGFCNATYQLNNYVIKDSYWGDRTGSFGEARFNAHWLEAAVGVKVEVLKNIYLGWSIRGKILFSKTQNGPFPYIIPGFGPGVNNTSVGINYSVYYQIPFMKMKTKYKIKKKLPPEETPTVAPSNTQPSTNQNGMKN